MSFEHPLRNAYVGEYRGFTREPNANTTMYFKFDGSLKDEISGTTYSASSISYGTLSSGKKYANFAGDSNSKFQISNNLSGSGNEITLLLWFQVANTDNMRNEFSNSSANYYTATIFAGGNLGAYYYNNSYDICGGASWSKQLYALNTRHLYGQTVKAGGKIKIFLDGNKIAEKDMFSSLRGSGADGYQFIGSARYSHQTNYFKGKMSEFIGEKIEWTEENMLEYYKATKSNYGL